MTRSDSIRISKVIKEFNIGVNTIVEFLKKKGFDVESNPNAKIDSEQYELVAKEFRKEQMIKEQSERIRIRLEDTPVKANRSMTEIGEAGNLVVRPLNLSKLESSNTLHERESIHRAQPSRNSLTLKVKSISYPGRVLTEGFYGFNAGLLLPQDVLCGGMPVPIDLSTNYITSTIKSGAYISVSLLNDKDKSGIARLSLDIGPYRPIDDKLFDEMAIGETYRLRIIRETPNYYILQLLGSKHRGIVPQSMLTESDIKKDGGISLQLLLKADYPWYMSVFVKNIAVNKTTDAPDSGELFAKFFEPEEQKLIDDKDKELVKMMLQKHPNMQRNTCDQVTSVELYCRVPEDSQLPVFLKSHPSYLDGKAFWINYYNQHGEDIIYLFHEKVIGEPTIVVEIKVLDENQFIVTNVDTNSGWVARKIIKNINKRTCLKMDAIHIHFLSRYDIIPACYETNAVIDYLSKLTDLNKRIIKDIEGKIEKKTTVSAHDYYILRDFLKYQIEKESVIEGNDIYISPDRINLGPSGYTTGYSSLQLKLTRDDYENLGLEDEEYPDRLHVSIVNQMGDELCAGYLTTDGHFSYLHFHSKGIDINSIITNGIYLHRRANVKHLKVLTDSLDSFVNDKLYKDLVLNTMQPTDEHKYDNIEFFNPIFSNSSRDNNQASAVRKALGLKDNGTVLIQGPPGSGKTTIIVEIIEQLVKEGKHVLVCSQAHAAVENIEKKLRKRHPSGMNILNISEEDDDNGITAIQYGKSTYSMFLDNNEKLLTFIRDKGAESVEVSNLISSFEYQTKEITTSFLNKHKHIATYYSEVKDSVSVEQMVSILKAIKSESVDLTDLMILNQYYCEQDVIFGTCVGVGTDYVMSHGGVHFDTVIIDEAGKANLAETIVPIQLGRRFVLVGDHKQLPPYIDREEIDTYSDEQVHKQMSKVEDDVDCSDEEYQNNKERTVSEIISALSNSLFSDFFNHENFPEENKITLNYQFRMNPEIGQYISDLFYEGDLNSGLGTEKQTLDMPNFPHAATFVDTSTAKGDFTSNPFESRSDDNSYFNEMEENIIAKNIVPVLDTIIDARPELTVGIITPYMGQYCKLKRRLSGTRYEDNVFTIDSIQGSEFDIVVFSFVRSFSCASNKKVGFLDDLRRLNVSLSRAKKKLILVGNLKTLQNPDAHNDFGIQGMAKPTDVFLKISRNIKQYYNLSDYDKFKDADPKPGRIFTGCRYSKTRPLPSITISLAEEELTFNLPKKALDFEDDGNIVDVVFTGYNKQGKPLFDLTYFEEFAATHQNNERTTGVVDTTPKTSRNGKKYAFIHIGKAKAILMCLKENNIGDTVYVQITKIDTKNRTIFCKETISMAEQLSRTPKTISSYEAILLNKQDYPIVSMQFSDRSVSSISFPTLAMTGHEGASYKFVKWPNGKFSLNKLYYETFISNHQLNNLYDGEVVNEDEQFYYVEVDGFCGTISKYYMDGDRTLTPCQRCKIKYMWYDEKKKQVQFKLA